MGNLIRLPAQKIWLTALLLMTCFLGAGWASQAATARLAEEMTSGQEPTLTGLAAEKGESALPPGGDNVPDLFHAGLRMVTALVVVLGLLFICYYGFRRFMNGRGSFTGRGAIIQVLATRYLGSKNALSVIDVEGEQFVIGLSPQGISFLTRLQQGPGQGRGEADGPAFENILRGKLDNV